MKPLCWLAFSLLAATTAATSAAEPLDPNGYTIQLIALPSPDRVESFARERGIDGLIATRVQRGDETLYVLLHGSYPDKATAKTAAANLPGALADLKPWVRSFASLNPAL